MTDFLIPAHRKTKNGVEVYPKFKVGKCLDLMIRGGDFYAVWLEDDGFWSTDEEDAIQLIDKKLGEYADTKREEYGDIKIMYLWDSDTGMIDKWHKYCQKQQRDMFHMLDERILFSNDKVKKRDYASKTLNYPLEEGPMPAYETLVSTLYSEEERHKIEWAIGSIVTGDSKTIQKFMVLYGAAGTGKSTILNIIQQLFEGYYSVFDAKALGSSSNAFALEAFKSNPLIAIQHDGDLSRIEDNTRLNSLVSHEMMTINEKFKSTYANRFKCFLFMGTNKPVKITDGKSGLLRRLIDVSPSGNKLSISDYRRCTREVVFELGAIAYHCKNVYLEDPSKYDDYIPTTMLGASNDFYNFIIDNYHIFARDDGVTMKVAWEMYKVYCDEAKVTYPFSQRIFKEELKNYFKEFDERFVTEDGTRMRSYYSGFRTEKFEPEKEEKKARKSSARKLKFDSTTSIFDSEYSDCPAQYANAKETPSKKWENVKTTLKALDTSRLHYVKPPENHIVIDFDIKDKDGKKSFKKNLEAASKWPETYSELSKSEAGIHLHYIYSGDVSKLSSIYDNDIEIKVFKGGSALRRKLTKCNDIPIAKISSGLPLKGEKKMLNTEAVANEKGLRTLIKRNLNKEYHSGTKPSIDFIYKILEDAYNDGTHYDVSDLQNEVIAFAAASTNQADYCLKLVNKMHFKSEDISVAENNEDAEIVFFDIEVFPNLFLVNWKFAGDDKQVVRMINPKPSDIEELIRFRLIGFNCRRYDNHLLYACLIGYTVEQLYELSNKIINSSKGSGNKYLFGEAYNISYTDVYDFASAGNKKSLKKLEIEMGIHHQELGLPWDQPVPEDMWIKVAEYCDNDVIATEAAFNYLSADWTARQILADLAGLSVNDTTNTLSTKIIFGNNRRPQDRFNYRNLADPVSDLNPDIEKFLKKACPKMFSKKHSGFEIPFDADNSLLPYFPGYVYESGVSTYMDEEVGEGGYVYAEPGIYHNVALLDISSMHPHSAIAECLFGVEYTTAFRDIVEGRVSIKHEDWDTVNGMLNGKLTPYVQKVIKGEMTSKDLANALKTAINSVYGLTSASFDNPFRDIRNKDNIVAKRGALFMIDLKHAVQERGYTVAHVKTDSIKIPEADSKIIKFVMEFGERYGYTFEHEATYDRLCLVNDAVYIAKDASDGHWTATGTQFQIPYVFKTLFSKEPIKFDDMCETKAVTSALYLKLDKDDEPEQYRFIGKVGRFCPMKKGGGELLRQGTDKDGNIKYASATGAKGYSWQESEIVTQLGIEDDIDRSYYEAMVEKAIEAISEYGNFDDFTRE